MFLMERNRN